jgi:hypothetical protein
MRAPSLLAVAVAALLSSLTLSTSCTPPPVVEGEGEGEEGEGEGEGEPGEGEGEGEGEPGEGEGEGEGEGGGIGSTCFRDAACAGTSICRFADPDGDGFVSDGTCEAPRGGLSTGSACATGDVCERGVCTGGLCAALCLEDGDCPAAMACQVTSFSFGADGGGTAEICVAAPNVAPVACVDDSVCLETNRVCNDVVGDGELSLQCGFPGTGAALGEGCTSTSLADRDACATGLCDGEVTGMCTRACSSNVDCAQGLVCSGPLFSNIDGGFCADPCIKNSQCPSGRTCQLRDSVDNSRFDTICAEQAGTLAPGTPTTNGRECPTALLIDGVCSELCINNSDCPAALPVCSEVTFAQPGREQQTIKACTAT